MTETYFKAAVTSAIANWLKGKDLAALRAEMTNPNTLAASLGAEVAQLLTQAGCTPVAIRELVMQAPYVHLKQVFNPDTLPDTPTGFSPVPDVVGTIAGRAAALAAHGLLNLETISYGSENGGELFVNLVPMPGSGRSAEKSKKELRGHTDGVSFPFNGEHDLQDPRIAPSPDLVTLVGLRNPDSVPTMLMPLQMLLKGVTPADITELKRQQYSIDSQLSFVPGMKQILGQVHTVLAAPILKDIAGMTCVRYSHTKVHPIVEGGVAEQAANNLAAACGQAAQQVVVGPGDLLIVNNRLSLHGRGKVGDSVGHDSRWLLRCYGLDTSDLPLNKRHGNGTPWYVLFP